MIIKYFKIVLLHVIKCRHNERLKIYGGLYAILITSSVIVIQLQIINFRFRKKAMDKTVKKLNIGHVLPQAKWISWAQVQH